jgi:acyl-CoA dehydrogenase
MLTTAIVDDPSDGPTVLHVAVPVSAPGVKIQDNWRTIGMRGTGSHDITLEDVFVPDAAVSARRPSGKWHPAIHLVVMIALPILNAVYVGVAEAARNLAIDAAKKKRDDKLVQSLAGEMENELTTAQLALARMIDLAMTAQPGEATSIEELSCRAILGRSTRATVDKAMELAGGGSFFRAARLERLFRDVQGVRFHPIQDKPQSQLVGRVALGMPFDE